MLEIREIENIIDHIHDNHPVFNVPKEQAICELLTSFEDLCSLSVMSSVLNPASLNKITDYMDALNMALQWVEQRCESNDFGNEQLKISETRYEQCVDLLIQYAYPYSVICSGYISFSRKRLSAIIDDNIVTFNLNKDNNSSWSDILREYSESSLIDLMEQMNPVKIVKANELLKQNIKIENDMLCYQLSDSIIDPFKEVACEHWNITSTLPKSWKFDLFTLKEYKEVWIWLATLCYIHFFSCFSIKDALVRIRNSIIIQPKDNIVDYISSMSGLTKKCVETIINYIIFEPSKKNAEIMYQPIVELKNHMLIIAPILIMGSKPERNLLAVISSNGDKEYSEEVNDLEGLMIQELEEAVLGKENIKIVKNKKLGECLPDIDFAILDKTSNALLLCELKWFAAADSAKEVYAKEDEITHGCEQMESIMSYAMSDKKHFFNQVFGDEDGESTDLFCCVIAKHNTRTRNKYVPVIDLKRIIELFSKNLLGNVFHIIRNHEYEIDLPQDAEITYQEVKYDKFIFRIPAICFGNEW